MPEYHDRNGFGFVGDSHAAPPHFPPIPPVQQAQQQSFPLVAILVGVVIGFFAFRKDE